jgi:hypothetical protein
MELFLTLTTLPADEPDLSIIIDKAGEFLLDAEDYERARALYAVAEKAFPDVAIYRKEDIRPVATSSIYI